MKALILIFLSLSCGQLVGDEFYRKLPQDLECPLVYWMVSQSVPHFDQWRSVGITANHLTFLAGVFQLFACFLLWRRVPILVGVFWFLGVFLDEIDGSYARYHHLCSTYGDLFDHLRDWICAGVLMIVLFLRYRLRWKDYLFLGSSLLLIAIFLGVQEQYVATLKPHIQTSAALGPLANLLRLLALPLKETLHLLRWVGTAHVGLLISLYLASLPILWRRKWGLNADPYPQVYLCKTREHDNATKRG